MAASDEDDVPTKSGIRARLAARREARRDARLARRAGRPASPMRELVTPEGIRLGITLASRGARFGALALDLVIIGLVMILSTILMVYLFGSVIGFERGLDGEGGGGTGSLQQLIAIVWIVFMFLLRSAYFLFFELGPRGATPGKRLTGIRIAARDGGRLTAEMVIARNLLRDIELFLPIVFIASAGAQSGPGWTAAGAWFAIFLLFPLLNRDVLRAGDVIAGTWVVERPRRKLEQALSASAPAPVQAPRRKLWRVGRGKGESESEVPVRNGGVRYRFDEAELAVYGEYELQTLERVLRENRQASIEPVYFAIADKIGRNDGYNDERAFLEDYYTQLRARLEAGMRMGRRKADKFSDAG